MSLSITKRGEKVVAAHIEKRMEQTPGGQKKYPAYKRHCKIEEAASSACSGRLAGKGDGGGTAKRNYQPLS